MRASQLFIVIQLDPKTQTGLGDLLKALEDERYRHTKLWAVFSCPRKDGYFHTDQLQLHRKIGSDPPPQPAGPTVKAAHPGNGVGVFVAFKPSQIDRDMNMLVWAPEQWMIELIAETVKWSQKATRNMLGRPFAGPMPYAELQDFV